VAAFRVSAITVRRAIRELITEGLLVGRQGLGVFVADNRRIVRSLAGEFKASLADNMRKSGAEPGIKPVSLRVERCDAEIARHLRLEPGTEVYRYDRLVLADGEPVARGTAHVPRALGDRIGTELADDFLLPLMRRHGVPIVRIDFAIEGGAAEEEEASLLGLAVGFPLLLVRYTPIGPDGMPIVTSCTRSRYDRFTYEMSMPLDDGGASSPPAS
jgi:DNA-binding GntR family transcriptional regulator